MITVIMESRRNGPQLSSRHDDDDDDSLAVCLSVCLSVLTLAATTTMSTDTQPGNITAFTGGLSVCLTFV